MVSLKINIKVGIMLIILFCITNLSFAGMQELSNDDLDNVTGQAGFTTFTMTDVDTGRVALIELDVKVDMYAEIADLNAGHYLVEEPTGIRMYKGVVPETSSNGADGMGWDLSWSDVKFGESEADPLRMNGLFLKVTLSPNNRIDQVLMGTSHAFGKVSANSMDAFTGRIHLDLLDPDVINALPNNSITSVPDAKGIAYWAQRTNAMNTTNPLSTALSKICQDPGINLKNNPLFWVFDPQHGIGLAAGFDKDSDLFQTPPLPEPPAAPGTNEEPPQPPGP